VTREAGGLVDLTLDPERSNFVSIFGRKGSGKSYLAQAFAESYPFDELVIDATADIHLPGALPLPSPVPSTWPKAEHPQRFRMVPNRLDRGHGDEVDRAIGLAFAHGLSLVWVDEIGEVAKANRVRPHFDLALHQGRHRRLSLLMAGPRPVDIDPLVLSQADWVFIFAMPHPADQERVAANLAIDRRELADLIAGLGRYEFIGYNAEEHELWLFPPLPRRRSTVPA
jgi:hypothetical protein